MNMALMYRDIPVALLTENLEILQIYSNFHYTPIKNIVEFVIDRIPSLRRKDIDNLLFNWGLNVYNLCEIAKITRLINPMDHYWLKLKDDENYQTIMNKKMNLSKEVYSPSGNNVKEYTWYNGHFGIKKKRLAPVITDTESEIACDRLSKLLGVKTCPTDIIDKDWTFSPYLYDFNKDVFRHVRLDMASYSGDLYNDLLNHYPDLKEDIYKMILFDFITRQDDRHRSNIAIVYKEDGSRYFYPLYDNGRSLFFEDTEEFIKQAVNNIPLYSTSFGEIGTYYDCVKSIENPSRYINTSIIDIQIQSCFNGLDLPKYKVDGCIEWIKSCLSIIRDLSEIKAF